MMAWYDVYRLLVKHDGDETKITANELEFVNKTNPNTNLDAFKMARIKYKEHKKAGKLPQQQDIKETLVAIPRKPRKLFFRKDFY